MTAKRVILELGTGNDLHGGDYTKAALRAVQDALHHSSLAMIRALKIDTRTGMFVDVTIGVQQPDKVDAEKVKASLPHGIVTVKVVKGGLDIADPENNDPAVIKRALTVYPPLIVLLFLLKGIFSFTGDVLIPRFGERRLLLFSAGLTVVALLVIILALKPTMGIIGFLLLGEPLDMVTLGFAVAVVATVAIGRRMPVEN